MDAGLRLRLNSVINKADARSVIIAMDHAAIAGPITGLIDPAALVKICTEEQVDALLTTKGSVDASVNQWDRQTSLILRLTGGFTVLGGSFQEELVVEPETALVYGASCAAITVKFGHEMEGKFIRQASLAIDRCHALGLPVMVEALVRGTQDGKPVDPQDPIAIAMAARMAAEIGADLVKTWYTGTIESFHTVVMGCPVPVMILGGATTHSLRDLFQHVADSLEAGGAGIAMGRNIWQQEQTALVIRAMNGLVHRHWSVTEACDTVGA
jgi:DhnA family fructose-bisphosphate aldolase class Ia